MRRSQNSRLSWLETIGNQKKNSKSTESGQPSTSKQPMPKTSKKIATDQQKTFSKTMKRKRVSDLRRDLRTTLVKKRREIWKKQQNWTKRVFSKFSSFPSKTPPKIKSTPTGTLCSLEKAVGAYSRLANLRKIRPAEIDASLSDGGVEWTARSPPAGSFRASWEPGCWPLHDSVPERRWQWAGWGIRLFLLGEVSTFQICWWLSPRCFVTIGAKIWKCCIQIFLCCCRVQTKASANGERILSSFKTWTHT